MCHTAKLFCRFFILSLCLYASSSWSQTLADTLRIERLLDKAKVLEADNIDSAYSVAKTCFFLSKKANFKRGIGKAFLRFGELALIKGSNDSAYLFMKQAIHISNSVNDWSTETYAWSKLSALFRNKGQKDSAFYVLYKAMDIAELNSDSINIGVLYNALAEMSFKYGEAKQALRYLNLAQGLFTRHQDYTNLSITFIEFGIIYYYQDNYESAINFYTKAMDIHGRLHYSNYLAHDFIYLGLCYEAQDNTKLARSYFQKALAHFTKYKMKEKKAEVLFNLGVSYYNQNNADSAILYLEKSRMVLDSVSRGEAAMRVLNLLSDAYAMNGNYTNAYKYHLNYSKLSDSLLDNEKVKQIAEMQTKYETDKKNHQINLLDQQNKTKTAQRNVLLIGIGFLCLLIFALFIYLFQRNRLIKKNAVIAQEKISGILKEQEIKSYNAMIEGQDEERKRIATDLHDRLGSMLSTVKLLFSALDEKIDKAQAENVTQYNKANSLLNEAVLEVRRISHDLSTGMVASFGLVAALEELCESMTESNIIRCKLLYFGLNARLEPKIEIGLYRIVQEMVNNILKHAKAKRITMQLNRTNDSISLTVEDDGIGFNVNEKLKRGGMGLKNIEARALRLGGVYHIDSTPGRGTISMVELPLNEDHDTNSHSG